MAAKGAKTYSLLSDWTSRPHKLKLRRQSKIKKLRSTKTKGLPEILSLAVQQSRNKEQKRLRTTISKFTNTIRQQRSYFDDIALNIPLPLFLRNIPKATQRSRVRIPQRSSSLRTLNGGGLTSSGSSSPSQSKAKKLDRSSSKVQSSSVRTQGYAEIRKPIKLLSSAPKQNKSNAPLKLRNRSAAGLQHRRTGLF